MQDLVANLQWRGMIHDIIPGTEEQLQKECTSGYIGFDPTAASLHIGNLATIMLLKHWQLAGHRPVVLVGGATGMIGDPSFKSAERKFLDEEELRHNQAAISRQLQQFLDFSDAPNGAILLNNLDWFQEMGFLKFLREAGKHISVNYMTAKESVKKRLETGLSFTEFTYQLLQGYDFYHLYKHHNVKVQMGGTDQWGNLTTGTELIRRKLGGSAFALTTPLITREDGSKFGKSESGENVWLDPSMTSPYAFYQFFLNCSDKDAERLIKVFTLLDQSSIEELYRAHNAAPHKRILQQTIARELTTTVHSEAACRQAAQTTDILFGNTTAQALRALSEENLLTVFNNVPRIVLNRAAWETTEDVLALVTTAANGTIFKSKGEGRRMIREGGVSLNKIKVTDPSQGLDMQLLHGRYLIVQQGKKNFYLIVIE